MIKEIYNKARKIIRGYEEETFDYLDMVQCKESNNKKMRLNLYIPNIDKRKMYGGQATALRFYENLAASLKCDMRILVDAKVDTRVMQQYQDFCLTESDSDNDLQKTICIFDSNMVRKRKLVVRENDIFITTFWITHFRLKGVISFIKECYKKNSLIVYLIQDYEPGFYRWSSEFMLAESTYKTGNTIAVFNSKNLRDYMRNNYYTFEHEYYFEPKLNSVLLKKLKEQNNVKRKKQVIVYGRPYVGRNCFSLIVKSINTFVEKYDPNGEWEFVSAGVGFKNIKLSNGKYLRVLGKLTLDEYAKVLSESSVGISLMCSPHPSYPPLEMAAFGIKTITNSFVCKDLTDFSSNIISVQSLDFVEVSNKIYEATCMCDNGFVVMNDSNYVQVDDEFDGIITEIAQLLLKGL